jgi:hypothetical protein
VVWTDPNTGESFVVDTTTGNSRRTFGSGGNGVGVLRRTLVTRAQEDDGRDEIPPWIGEALTVISPIQTS